MNLKGPARPEVLRLLAEGMTSREVARQVGVSVQRVSQIQRSCLQPKDPPGGRPRPKGPQSRLNLLAQWSIVNRVLRMLRAGKAPDEVAAETGVPTGRIQQVARAAGLTRKASAARSRPRSKIDHDRILRLVRAGKSRLAIAAEAGVSLWTVTQARKTVGLAKKGGPRKVDPAEVLRLLAKGMTGGEVALRTGISESRVSQIRAAAKVAQSRAGNAPR
jgi:DNA-binding CsgD family transcriptional regulator